MLTYLTAEQQLRFVLCGFKLLCLGLFFRFGLWSVLVCGSAETKHKVTEIRCINDRLIKIKLNGDTLDTVLIQTYMPAGRDEEKEEEIYDILEELIDEEKGNCNLTVMGHWNAIV